MDVANKQIAVAGYGVEGQTTARYLADKGAHVTILDENPAVTSAEFEVITGPEAFSQLESYDLVFRTAGLRPDKLNCSEDKITTVYKLLLKEHKQQVIGVTGTKGKGTTATLIHHILLEAGEHVLLGGNIGVHPFEFYDDITSDTTVVLELSSFQLIDVTDSPHGAVVLMIEPDHLDWHSSYDEYIGAKANIVAFQNEYDITVYNPNNQASSHIAAKQPGALPYMTGTQAHIADQEVRFGGHTLLPVSKVGLRGPHNLENICAAATVCWYWLTEKGYEQAEVVKILGTAIQQFNGLADRLEELDVVNGVTYVNDTFSANPMALRAALNSYSEPKVVIVGGYDKKLGTVEVVKALVERLDSLRHIVLIGQTAPAIALALREANVAQFTQLGTAVSMTDIVAEASHHAQAGDVVLLSPGHASFDMFKNYKDRGQQYRQSVAALTDITST